MDEANEKVVGYAIIEPLPAPGSRKLRPEELGAIVDYCIKQMPRVAEICDLVCRVTERSIMLGLRTKMSVEEVEKILTEFKAVLEETLSDEDEVAAIEGIAPNVRNAPNI